jgi:hypothetical protein
LDIANNYGFLNFDTLNLDGSIALNSGSKYNKIYPDQLKILIKANDLNLLLNYHRTKKEYKKELKWKMKKYQNMPMPIKGPPILPILPTM